MAGDEITGRLASDTLAERAAIALIVALADSLLELIRAVAVAPLAPSTPAGNAALAKARMLLPILDAQFVSFLESARDGATTSQFVRVVVDHVHELQDRFDLLVAEVAALSLPSGPDQA